MLAFIHILLLSTFSLANDGALLEAGITLSQIEEIRFQPQETTQTYCSGRQVPWRGIMSQLGWGTCCDLIPVIEPSDEPVAQVILQQGERVVLSRASLEEGEGEAALLLGSLQSTAHIIISCNQEITAEVLDEAFAGIFRVGRLLRIRY